MWRKMQRSIRNFLTTRTILTIVVTLVIGLLIGSTLGSLKPLQKALFGTAFPPPPGGYTCLPTCAENDARFFSIPGTNMDSFAGARTVVWITVPSDYTSWELGIFDGDSGKDESGQIGGFGVGHWDENDVEVTYSLYADPAKDGAGKTLLGEWHGNQDPMPDNAWFNIPLNVHPEARSPSGHYIYRLECTRPAEGWGISAFKLRSNAYLSTGIADKADASFAFVGMIGSENDMRIVYPQYAGDMNNPGPSTYDGAWTFRFAVPSEEVTLEFWNGDFDRGATDGGGADTDDLNTEGRPYWAGPYAVEERAGGMGSPADDHSWVVWRREPPVFYEILDPSGNPIYTDAEPSGTEEWERFVISTDLNVQADTGAGRLPAGLYTWRITGLDAHNTVWIRTNYEICAPEGCPPPPCPVCEPCQLCEEPTPVPPAPTSTPEPTPVPEPPPCPAPAPVDLLYILDTSGSMEFLYPGSGTKLDAAKESILTLNNWVAQQNNGSRVALITFHGAGQGNGSPPIYSTDIQVVSGFTADIGAVNNMVQGLGASGSTPTAETLNLVASWLPGNWDPNHLPLVILISDGVPTVDLDHFGFQDNHVQKVDVYEGGNPRSPDSVRGSGRLYDRYGQRAGEPLADTMLAIQNLKATLPSLPVYAVAVQSTEGGIFNDQILRYIAALGGGEFYYASDANSLAAALQWAYIDSACGGTPPPPPPPPEPPQVDCSQYVLAGREKTAPRQITLKIRNNSNENRQVVRVHIGNWLSEWGAWDWVKVFGEQYAQGTAAPPADAAVNRVLNAGQEKPIIFKFMNPLNDAPGFNGFIELDNGCQINF